jgi:NTP pyrophosphatase (non-canonical NTP hydrolase)
MSTLSLETIRDRLHEFVAERDWEQFHDPKNLAMAVVSEAGELAAEYRWIANAQADEWSRDPEHRIRVADEAADVAIAVLLFFDRIGVDFLEAIEAKIEVNRRHYPVEEARGSSERPNGR